MEMIIYIIGGIILIFALQVIVGAKTDPIISGKYLLEKTLKEYGINSSMIDNTDLKELVLKHEKEAKLLVDLSPKDMYGEKRYFTNVFVQGVNSSAFYINAFMNGNYDAYHSDDYHNSLEYKILKRNGLIHQTSVKDKPRQLIFKSNEKAFEYACKYLDCSASSSEYLPALVTDILNSEIFEDDPQILEIKVVDSSGGTIIPRCESECSQELDIGDLVVCDVKNNIAIKKLEPIYDIDNESFLTS